jgi:hypothetical protein
MRGWRSSRAKAREAELHAALASGPPLTWPPAPEAAPPAPQPVPAPAAAAPAAPAPVPPAADALLVQTQLMRLLESVTNMCERVTELVEADRAERALLVGTLRDLGRAITEGAASAVVAPPITIAAAAEPERAIESAAARAAEPAAEPEPLVPAGERVLGGSMPAGPDLEPEAAGAPAQDTGAEVIDLRDPARTEPARTAPSRTAPTPTEPTRMEIAVEVRGRFGDRWVDGFEICEVMTTPDGPRYRLRRRRDGAVLPELFDATSIRHVETFEELNGDGVSAAASRYWSRS